MFVFSSTFLEIKTVLEETVGKGGTQGVVIFEILL